MKLVNGVIKPLKGKAMTIRVPSDIRKLQLLRKAIERHQAYDRKFDPDAGYTIAYPDGTEILTLPGQSTQIFQLDKYKEDIGKPYNRISFYLVKREELLCEGKEDDPEDDLVSVSSNGSVNDCTYKHRESVGEPNEGEQTRLEKKNVINSTSLPRRPKW